MDGGPRAHRLGLQSVPKCAYCRSSTDSGVPTAMLVATYVSLLTVAAACFIASGGHHRAAWPRRSGSGSAGSAMNSWISAQSCVAVPHGQP